MATKRKKKNGLFSNLRMIKAHDKRAIQGAGLKGRLEAIDAQIRDVTVDPFYKREKGLQGLALRRLRERRREIQAQMKKNPAAQTENQVAWRKGYEHGYKGLNSRPDYPKVGLAGSYRLGYEAGERRRKGKAQPRKNPSPQLLAAQRKIAARVTRLSKEAQAAYNAGNKAKAKKLWAQSDALYQRLVASSSGDKTQGPKGRLPNPKREAKTSKDAFGVTHENPDSNAIRKHFVVEKGKGFWRGLWVVIDTRSGKQISAAAEKKDALIAASDWNKKIAAIKNPSVAAIAEKFQGGVDGAIEEFHAASSAPANLARAGKLVFLKVGAKTFRLPAAMVAIAPNEKLWIVSKRAPVFSTKAKPGEGLDVGEITQICYETAKRHIGNGKRFEYVHEFGEDGGKRPHLIIDHEGMPILHGGDYKIRAEGIVN